MLRQMIRRFVRFVPIAVTLSLAFAWMAARVPAQAGASGTSNGEWPAYAGDLRNFHYSPLDQINASNFNRLEVAWRFKTDSLGTRPEFKLEGTPLVVRGVVYATAGTRRSVVALDAATGELLWVHGEHEGGLGDGHVPVGPEADPPERPGMDSHCGRCRSRDRVRAS